MDQDETWHESRPRRLGPGHVVLDGDLAPPKKGAEPLCCGQMAGWIKMPLVTEVGLGPGDIVLDGDSCSPPKEGNG